MPARTMRRKSSKRRHGSPTIRRWAAALQLARKELGVHGFMPVRRGSKLYLETKRRYEKMGGKAACGSTMRSRKSTRKSSRSSKSTKTKSGKRVACVRKCLRK